MRNINKINNKEKKYEIRCIQHSAVIAFAVN